MNATLTIKQEKFCIEYHRLGSQIDAYKIAYNCGNMASATISKNATTLLKNPIVAARVAYLQNEAAIRNKVSVDEIVETLAGILRADPRDMYDENGALKNIHDIPQDLRRMITQWDTFEHKEKAKKGKDKGKMVVVGYSRKVRLLNKLDAVEKLMRHLGGYREDAPPPAQIQVNTQNIINVAALPTEVLLAIQAAYIKQPLLIEDNSKNQS